jgi:hypothetical protein
MAYLVKENIYNRDLKSYLSSIDKDFLFFTCNIKGNVISYNHKYANDVLLETLPNSSIPYSELGLFVFNYLYNSGVIRDIIKEKYGSDSYADFIKTNLSSDSFFYGLFLSYVNVNAGVAAGEFDNSAEVKKYIQTGDAILEDLKKVYDDILYADKDFGLYIGDELLPKSKGEVSEEERERFLSHFTLEGNRPKYYFRSGNYSYLAWPYSFMTGPDNPHVPYYIDKHDNTIKKSMNYLSEFFDLVLSTKVKKAGLDVKVKESKYGSYSLEELIRQWKANISNGLYPLDIRLLAYSPIVNRVRLFLNNADGDNVGFINVVSAPMDYYDSIQWSINVGANYDKAVALFHSRVWDIDNEEVVTNNNFDENDITKYYNENKQWLCKGDDIMVAIYDAIADLVKNVTGDEPTTLSNVYITTNLVSALLFNNSRAFGKPSYMYLCKLGVPQEQKTTVEVSDIVKNPIILGIKEYSTEIYAKNLSSMIITYYDARQEVDEVITRVDHSNTEYGAVRHIRVKPNGEIITVQYAIGDVLSYLSSSDSILITDNDAAHQSKMLNPNKPKAI